VWPVGGFFVAASPMAEAPRLDAASLRGHDATVRQLAAAVDAILPFRFGALVADEAQVVELLEPQAADYRDALALVTGREQMTLRIYGAAAGVARRAVPPDGGAGGPGARYLATRMRRRARRQSVPEIEPLRPALAAWIRAERAERHSTPPLVASVYHLVERGRSPEYLAALRGAVRRLVGIRVRASGPWAPYGFAPEALWWE
jgi:hypothetical protein